MTSPERPSELVPPQSKVELLIELAALDEAIQPYQETGLSIDEMYHYERLLEHRDWVLDELEKLQS